jgi:hypothetical protein
VRPVAEVLKFVIAEEVRGLFSKEAAEHSCDHADFRLCMFVAAKLNEVPQGTRVGRDEDLGLGRVGQHRARRLAGQRGFANFVNDQRYAVVPLILETPKAKDGRGTDLDRVNLKRLRSLFRN